HVVHLPDGKGGRQQRETRACAARSIDRGATWSEPQLIDAFPTEQSEDLFPSVCTDSQGRWMMVWHSQNSLGGTIGEDDDILFATSDDNAATWSTPQPLNDFAASDDSLDTRASVSTDGNGTWITVWSSKNSLGGRIGTQGNILLARSNDFGKTWSHA